MDNQEFNHILRHIFKMFRNYKIIKTDLLLITSFFHCLCIINDPLLLLFVFVFCCYFYFLIALVHKKLCNGLTIKWLSFCVNISVLKTPPPSSSSPKSKRVIFEVMSGVCYLCNVDHVFDNSNFESVTQNKKKTPKFRFCQKQFPTTFIKFC